MTDEKTTQKPEEKPLTLMEETKQTIENLNKAKAEAKTEADRLERLKSDQLLSGTAGIRPNETKPEKTAKERAKEYAQSIMAGKRPQ